MPFPSTVQTVFNGRAAGSFPDLRARRLRPVREPERGMRRHPGMRGGGQPERLHPARTQGCATSPAFLVPTFFVNILSGLCSRVDQINCGLGVVNTSNPQTATTR